MKEYILLIEDKEDNNVFIKCKDLNEVENEFLKFGNKVNNFEIYKAIDTNECVEFVELVLKRFIKNFK